ncbi:MAG: hypothetical protein JXP73_18550 [Deltaproteobacteria bacterium]|nr:hypothetical protein [Deltaproteobacteria bacterium]
MSDKQMRNRNIPTAVAAAGWRRWRRSLLARGSWVGTVAAVALVHGPAGLAGPLDDAVGKAAVRFEPVATPPPALEGRLQGPASSVQVAATPQGTLYAVTDQAGKARVWLLRDNVIVGDLAVPASREHMYADWAGSFAFSLGGLPVVAISWRFGQGFYGIEDFGFWAVQGSGRFLGGLPGGTRSPCDAGEVPPSKECGRCGSVKNIPIDARLAGVEPDRARFVQRIAAIWYHHFAAAAEIFEQDYVLTANGLVPDGSPRRTRNTMSPSQAKERIKPLLRDYFRLAKSRSRPEIAPEFLTCFEQLVDLSPEFGQGHYNVGCMHALLGNRKQAVASITKAIALDPKYRKVARRDPDVGSVRDDPEIVRVLGEAGK